APAGLEHHEVVVAAQGDELSGIAKPQKVVHDAARVGAAVHVVAQCDDLVVRSRSHRFQQPLEDVGIAMNVANGEITHLLSPSPLLHRRTHGSRLRSQSARAIRAASSALATISARLARSVLPPVISASRASRNGVTALPRTPASAAFRPASP